MLGSHVRKTCDMRLPDKPCFPSSEHVCEGIPLVRSYLPRAKRVAGSALIRSIAEPVHHPGCSGAQIKHGPQSVILLTGRLWGSLGSKSGAPHRPPEA